MRKVTASAVILTALTGCGQSPLHSRQWSFKAPAGDTDSSALAAADALTGQRSRASLPLATSTPDQISAMDQLSGKTPNRQAAVYSRPGGSLSQLTSPAPERSRAYLFSPSAPAQADASAPNAANPSLPDLTFLDLGLTDLTRAIANKPIEDVSASSPTDLALALPTSSNAEVLYPAPATTAASAAAAPLVATIPGSSERYTTSDYVPSVEGDNLPRLKPAGPTDFANLPLATPSVREASESEAVPIGTAILRDLQASSDTTLQVTPTASEAIADQRSLSPPDADSSPALVATLPAVQASGHSTDPEGSTPNNSIQAEPTLDGLLQTMPPRTDAPLVIRNQANRQSFRILPTELPIVWRSTISPLAESPIETANPAAVQPSQSQVTQAQPQIEFKFEPSLRADDGQARAPSPFPLTSKASLYEKTLLPRKHFVQNSLSRS